MAQQNMTAVEWLVKELNLEGYDYTISQAKAMEKQQIMDACNALADYPFTKEDSENYYNETYNK